MKKVLFISYAFPPMAGGGIFRTVKFIKYLPEFGIMPRVLTVKDAYHPFKDESLLSEIPKEVKITRIDYNEPAAWFNNRYWQSFLNYIWYPWFSISDKRIAWFKAGVAAALDIIKKEKIDCIYTSFASATDHLIALEVKRQTGVKWVADFRDEWASSNYLHFPTPLHRAHIHDLEKNVITAADVVTTVSEPITDYFKKISGNEKKCITITNGFDAEDFNGNISVPKRDFCQILYTGELYGERSADTFSQAVEELNLPKLHVDSFGGKNRISHAEAIKAQREADILLLVLAPDDQPAVFTGKIFEYLAARRPILALAPEQTEAAKLVRRLGIGEVVNPLDKEGIKKKIKKMYEAWERGTLKTPQIDINPFERKHLTSRLAQIFHSFENPTKVLIVANSQSPQSKKLADYLSAQGYETHFAYLGGQPIDGAINHEIKQKPLINNFLPLYLIEGFINKFKALGELKKIINEIHPDIVHGHGVNFGGILAVQSGFRPVVVTTRGSDILLIDDQPWFEQYLIKKAINEADIVTGNSKALEKQALSLGVDKKRWREVYFGIDTQKFKPMSTRDLKKELNIGNEKVIFCPRSIKPLYNTDVLIKALHQVEEDNWKLIILGQNAEEQYFAKVKQLIRMYGFENRVIFLPKVSPDEMAKLYNLADVTVSIAQSDGAAASFLEAMACGAKIVMSEVDFIKEWSDGDFWSVPIGDINATADAINDALSISAEEFEESVERNRRLILERAELNESFHKFEDIYHKLIGKSEE